MNNELHKLGLVYCDVLPVLEVDKILTANGFQTTECWEYSWDPEQHARVHQEVGEGKWLSLIARQMETTGRWEVVAYVN